MKHWHHIVPRHMGGTDDPSNLIELTVEEHAEAHRKLWEEHGNEFDLVAYRTLSGQISKAEAWLEVRYSEEWSKRARAAWTPERKAKLIERNRTRKHRPEVKAKIKAGWTEERRAAASERMSRNRRSGLVTGGAPRKKVNV